MLRSMPYRVLTAVKQNEVDLRVQVVFDEAPHVELCAKKGALFTESYDLVPYRHRHRHHHHHHTK